MISALTPSARIISRRTSGVGRRDPRRLVGLRPRSADRSDQPSGLSSITRLQPPSCSAWMRRGARSRRSGSIRSNHRSCGSSMCESAEIFDSWAASIGAPRYANSDIPEYHSERGDPRSCAATTSSLSPEHHDLRGAFAALFEKECPPERVRAAEPLGFDRDLWSTLRGDRGADHGAPRVRAAATAAAWSTSRWSPSNSAGGVAPVPLIDGDGRVAAARGAAGAPDAVARRGARGARGSRRSRSRPSATGERQLVGAGAIADDRPRAASTERSSPPRSSELPPPVANLASRADGVADACGRRYHSCRARRWRRCGCAPRRTR